MAYVPTTLIAREGYAGLGGMDRNAAASYCGQKFGVTSKDFQPCVDFYVSGKTGDYQAGGTTNSAATPSTLSQIGGVLTNLLGGAITSYAAAKGGAGQQPVVVQSGPPRWLLPVALGGLGLFAVLMLKKRSAPRTNPGRRRRRRRRNPRYGRKASKLIERRMRDFYAGRMKSSSGRRVRSRSQALAIAMSEARSKGYKVPRVR